jgi:Sap, sulfolipid-1-addressing protein
VENAAPGAQLTSVDVELGLTALAAMLSPTTLSFSVFALVLGDRPMRTGLWFFFGAFGVTLIIGVVAAFALGNAAAPSGSSETPPTWVAIADVVLGGLLLLYVIRALRRPRDPKRAAGMVEKMSGLASSPAIGIVAAGATLANPGGFIPIALKDISQLNPSAGEYIVLWLSFALISLLPLLAALLSLLLARDWTMARLHATRGWLERHARTLAAAIILLLAAALLRNGIVALTS